MKPDCFPLAVASLFDCNLRKINSTYFTKQQASSLVASEAACSQLLCINISSLKTVEPTSPQCWDLHFQGHKLDTV